MKHRGVVILLALLLASVFLVLGLGLLSSRVAQYRGARSSQETRQALALAQSGLEDARMKLAKVIQFPPPGADSQWLYTYSEDVPGVGFYTVEVESRFPALFLIRAEGNVGLRERPTARRRLEAQLQRSDLRYLRFTDLGSP